jgi:hypothetical protein
MRFTSNNFAWMGTGVLSLIIGFVINSGALCSLSCAGKGTVFLYLGVLAIVVGVALAFVKTKGRK